MSIEITDEGDILLGKISMNKLLEDLEEFKSICNEVIELKIEVKELKNEIKELKNDENNR